MVVLVLGARIGVIKKRMTQEVWFAILVPVLFWILAFAMGLL